MDSGPAPGYNCEILAVSPPGHFPKNRHAKEAMDTTRPVPELSIVMPCFNEAESLETILGEWQTFLNEEAIDFEIVVVNDGSTDGTGRLLDKLRKESSRLRVVHQLRTGTEIAVRRGIQAARGRYLLQLHATGRFEPMDFLRLWEAREGRALVLGVRTHRLDGAIRRLYSLALRKCVKLCFGVEIPDSNIPFRLVRRDVAVACLARLDAHAHALNVLMSCLIVRDYPDRVAYVPVPSRLRPKRRRARQSPWLASLAFRTGIEMLKHRTIKPMTNCVIQPA